LNEKISILQRREAARQLLQSGQWKEAESAYRDVLLAEPNDADALNAVGHILRVTGRPYEAAAALRRALALQPAFSQAARELAEVLTSIGQSDDAVTVLEQSLAARPDAQSFSMLAVGLATLGRIDQAIAFFDQALSLHPQDQVTLSNRLFGLYFDPRYDAAAILAEHQEWDRVHAQPLRRQIQPHDPPGAPGPRRRLRIGYVSPDFRNHCQAFFTIPLLSRHDHEPFEIYCYSSVEKPDDLTQRIRSYADVWRDVAALDDGQVAQMVRDDRIDILMDLTLHMSKGRPLVFARKPAPIQVAWLGCPGTTGLSVMDYRFTDPYLDPPGLNDAHYSETSIRLPDSFWCYDPLGDQPAVNASPAAANGFVTFGCLNNFCKVNAPLLPIWSQVLQAVPNSRFILRAPPSRRRGEIVQTLGIDPKRVEFVDYRPRPQYLQIYHRIDIGLDTFPYNGHTTSLDALWMGVPVVTRAGQTAVSRAGLSQAMNLGLGELVAQTPQQFVDIAKTLAADLPKLNQLRSTLRQRMLHSPLMDANRFARNVEAAYRHIWQRWCRERS